MTREKLSPQVEQRVLVRSGRRCALCWGLEHDLGVKPVQIAHVDRDHTNNEVENLAVLCLPHHDQYDTTPRQTKKLSPKELITYRNELYDILDQKKRTVATAAKNPSGVITQTTTNAQRLGLLIETFDEDVGRAKPNGLLLYHRVRSAYCA